MSIFSNLKNISKTLSMALVATVVAFGGVEIIDPSVAEAGAKKKVEFVSKGIGKFGSALEKAGRKAQKKRGIVGKVGGILKKTGKGTKKTGKGLGKITKKASNGVSKALNKSKIGKGIKKGYKNVKSRQDQVIDGAFKKCGGKICKSARNGVRLLAPL